MKGLLKYAIIAAIGYFIYNQYKKSQFTKPEEIPLGSGGAGRPQNPPTLEAIQGIKKLPTTY